MKLIPLDNNIIVEIDDSTEKVRNSGLIIVKTQEEKAPQFGVVTAVGKECEGVCRIGDTVIFEKYAGDEFVDEATRKRYLIVSEDDIIAIYEKK